MMNSFGSKPFIFLFFFFFFFGNVFFKYFNFFYLFLSDDLGVQSRSLADLLDFGAPRHQDAVHVKNYHLNLSYLFFGNLSYMSHAMILAFMGLVVEMGGIEPPCRRNQLRNLHT